MLNGCPVSNNVVSDLGKRLLEAARLGNADEVTSLMSNGAPLTTDWLGTTPLHLASIYGHTGTAEILINSGISKDGRTKVDKVPLHFACQHGHLGVVKLLVNGGAHIDATDMLKMTPLHWAVEANSFDICLFLLNAGVKRDMKNKFDKTPLTIAKDKGFETIQKLLSNDQLKVLQEIDVLNPKSLREKQNISVKMCRDDSLLTSNNLVNKRQKTRRFPMIAGTWTGGEAQTQERLEISERRKLGCYKKRQHHYRDTLANSLLQNLQSAKISTSIRESTEIDNKLRSISSNSSSIHYNENDSPLQKLEQTVRLSTCVDDVNSNTRKSTVEEEADHKNVTVKVSPSALILNLPHRTIEIPFIPASTALHTTQGSQNIVKSNIPIISTESFNKLPDNIQAIPLDISVDDYEEQEKDKTSSILLDHFYHNSSTSPVHLPMVLLHQILHGDVTLHTLDNKIIDEYSDDYDDDECDENDDEGDNSDLDTERLVGITTEMGIIPLVPVSDEGGLRLIPVENASVTSPILPKQKTDNHIYQENIIKKENCEDVVDDAVNDDDSNEPFRTEVMPLGHTTSQILPPILVRPLMVGNFENVRNFSNLNYFPRVDHHCSFNPMNTILSGQQNPPGSYLNQNISGHCQPSIIMSADGVFIHPSHPSIYPLSGQLPMYPQNSYIPSPFMPLPLHPSMAHSAVHSTVQSAFPSGQAPIPNPIIPQYVYVDRASSGVLRPQMHHFSYGGSLATSLQERSQEPDASSS